MNDLWFGMKSNGTNANAISHHVVHLRFMVGWWNYDSIGDTLRLGNGSHKTCCANINHSTDSMESLKHATNKKKVETEKSLVSDFLRNFPFDTNFVHEMKVYKISPKKELLSWESTIFTHTTLTWDSSVEKKGNPLLPHEKFKHFTATRVTHFAVIWPRTV